MSSATERLLHEIANLSEWLEPREVARHLGSLGVTEHRVREWVRCGRLPAVRVGNRLLIAREDLPLVVTEARAA